MRFKCTSAYHWMQINQQPRVQVEGTYHLKGGDLRWSQQRQTRPFSLYLRPGEADQWVVVDPPAT